MPFLPRSLPSLPAEAGPITALAFSPDGKKLAAVTRTGSLHVWCVPTGRAVLQQHLGPQRLLTVTWEPSGSSLCVGGEQGALYVLPCRAHPPITTHLFAESVTHLAFSTSPRGRCLVVTGSTLTILEKRGARPLVTRYATRILDACWSSDERSLAVICQDGLLDIWDAERALRRSSLGDIPLPRCLSWHPDGHRLAIGTASGQVQVRTMQAPSLPWHLPSARAPLQALRWGTRYLVGCADQAKDLTCWDEQGRLCAAPPTGASAALAVHPQGSLLATGLHTQVALTWL